MAKKQNGKDGKDSRRIDSPKFITSALTGEGGDSSGIRRINTGRDGQWIKSAVAMDQQGKGQLPEKLRAGSINADTWGSKGKLDVSDQANFDHSMDKSRSGDHRAFSEETLRSVRPPSGPLHFIQRNISHSIFSIGGGDDDGDQD